MKLLTKEIETRLRANHMGNVAASEEDRCIDHRPVLKVFDPCGSATWLFTELDEDNRLFGLCDLGMGFPELGYACLEELSTVRNRMGLGLERDRGFVANKTLSQYADEARMNGGIVL